MRSLRREERARPRPRGAECIERRGSVPHLLVIASGDDRAVALEDALRGAAGGFDVRAVPDFVEGLDYLARRDVAVCLLELDLVDRSGLRDLLATLAQAPNVPVVALLPDDQEEHGAQAVAEGARDYLTERELAGDMAGWTLRRAMERHERDSLGTQSRSIDPATGLLTLDALRAVGERRMRAALRTGRDFAVIHAQLDETDLPDGRLREIAERLRAAVRSSDAVARTGPTEFHVLLSEVSEGGEHVARRRLVQTLEDLGAPAPRTGVARFTPREPVSFTSLLARAAVAEPPPSEAQEPAATHSPG
jgi:PleD family two-component response regulator